MPLGRKVLTVGGPSHLSYYTDDHAKLSEVWYAFEALEQDEGIRGRNRTSIVCHSWTVSRFPQFIPRTSGACALSSRPSAAPTGAWAKSSA